MYVTVSVSMPPELADQIDQAKKDEETRSQYIRRLIRSPECVTDGLERPMQEDRADA
jgi:metal-responsive CopG/Arc/MetJ family transcriptional regulator